MSGRQGALMAAVLALLALGSLLLIALSPEGPERKPRKVPARAAQPAPRAIRASLPPPPGVELPELPQERPQASDLTPDDRRAMNFAVEGALIPARDECLVPWMEEEGLEAAEFVFDAVLYDGRLVDIGFRSLTSDVPADVLGCVADRAWYADWPQWDLQGELRLQRSQ
jgi:hypothetical protein